MHHMINPRRMRRRVTVVVLCVRVSVYLSFTTKSAAYLVFTSQSKFYRVLYGVFNVFTIGFPWKCFVQEFWHHFPVTRPLPSSFPSELSTAKRDSDDFFSTRNVYMVDYRPNNTTGSSLIVCHWQRGFLAIAKCWHSVAHMILLDITQSHAMCIFVVTLTVCCTARKPDLLCKHLAVMLDS